MATVKTRFDLARLSRGIAPSKLAITVLAGGPSAEREVSLQSGKAVAEALRSLGHSVYLEDVAPDRLAGLARNVDCVFVALHGAFGEDGEVQKILERRGLKYVGSRPDACALAMDKADAKACFAEQGIPTPAHDVATAESIGPSMACWNLPVVVKPVKQGSSLSCHIVRDYAQFRPAVEDLVREYGRCLVEEYIPGKEITVGVLGDQALPPIEIRTRREFYDYQAKYVDEDTEYLFDIDLPEELLEHMMAMSRQAHRCLGCRHFSRVDWRVDAGRLRPYLLEVNVIPGLTDHSLLPKAARQVGMTMPMLCQYLVEAALSPDEGLS